MPVSRCTLNGIFTHILAICSTMLCWKMLSNQVKYKLAEKKTEKPPAKALKSMPTGWETNNDHSGCISLVYFCLPAGYFRQFLGNQIANQRRQRRIPSAADSLSSFLFPQPPCPLINLSLVFPVALFPTPPFSSGFSLCFTKNLLFQYITTLWINH